MKKCKLAKCCQTCLYMAIHNDELGKSCHCLFGFSNYDEFELMKDYELRLQTHVKRYYVCSNWEIECEDTKDVMLQEAK